MLFFLVNLNLISQTYVPIPDSNSIWSVLNKRYLVIGDSLVNGLTYNKFFVTLDTNLTNESLQYIGMIRQDIGNKRVYGLSLNDTIEKLLYDFSLSVNDTITVYYMDFQNFGFSDPIKVTNIDSVLINGTYRKQLHFDCFDNSNLLNNEKWIEGIGSTFGPLNPGLTCFNSLHTCYPKLLCHQNNGIYTYTNPLFENCYYECVAGLENYESVKLIRIFPNPSNSKVFVESESIIEKIEVFTISGLLINYSVVKMNTGNLDFSNFEDGIYLIKVVTKDGTLNRKVLINKS